MKAIIKANLSFLLPYLVFLFVAVILIIINSKADTHLEFNEHHSVFFDRFFFIITYLGDGVGVLLVTLMLLAVKYRYALIVGLSNIISAAITQVLKHTLFNDVVRPKKFFEGIHDLYLVPGVDNYLYNSFPSGHTTCAFSLYFAIALIIENKFYKFLFFMLALLVGYSRIYLSQHFLEDVVAGSLIGVITTITTFYFIQKNRGQGLDRSLITLNQ